MAKSKYGWLRLLVDVAMLALLIALMHPRFTRMGLHARMGHLLLVVVLVHLKLNWGFVAAWWQRSVWTKRRKMLAAVSAGLFVALAVTMVSIKLIPASSHGQLRVLGHAAGFLRLHLVAGWLSLILAAVHLGLHGTAVVSFLPKAGWTMTFLNWVWKLAALAGIAGAFKIELLTRLTGLYPYFQRPVLEPQVYYASVVFIVILISTLTHYIVRKW